jgi:hypothetical protein
VLKDARFWNLPSDRVNGLPGQELPLVIQDKLFDNAGQLMRNTGAGFVNGYHISSTGTSCL